MKAWFTEDQTPGLRLGLRITEILHQEQTAYQELAIYQTTQLGRCLVLDDCVMTTEEDEFTYHEMIAHPILIAHPEPRRVLVVGGGDGGTIREVLKHPAVEEAHLAEIDERVIALSRQYLPSISSALDDPRCRICVTDGIEYVARHEEYFDVILVDSTDPVGPAVGLFSEDFYRSIHRALTPDGIFAAQTESPFFNRELIQRIQAALRQIYPVVRLHYGVVPTYPGAFWTFSSGSKGPHPARALESPVARARAEALPTRYYSPEVGRACFQLPPFVQELTR